MEGRGFGERKNQGEERKSRRAKRRAKSKRARRGKVAPYIVSGIAGCYQVTVGVELKQNTNSGDLRGEEQTLMASGMVL